MTTFEGRNVLAGAYRGRDVGARALLTHIVEVRGGQDVRVLCRRVKLDSLCDIPEAVGAANCPECTRRLDKIFSSVAS